MTLLQPIWLLLAIPLGMALWHWRLLSRLLLGMRLAILILVLLALSGLALMLPSRAGTVVVLADRSLSMPADKDEHHKLAIELIKSAMDPGEHLKVVAFGQRAVSERLPQVGKFSGFVNDVGGDASNLADALDMALALIPAESPGKVLVLSDGQWTGRDPQVSAIRAAARGIAIDYRPLQRTAANDLAIERIDIPQSVNAGESFLITAWVQAPSTQAASFELLRGGKRLLGGKRKLVSGLNRLTFRDQAGTPGTQSYTLHVEGEHQEDAKRKDPVPENNRARFLVGIQGPRPILLATAAAPSGLGKLLQAGGLKVHVARPERCAWTLPGLSRYSAVILENVPAEKIGFAGMQILAAWVEHTGAGLMMTGGRQSYSPGGFFKSPLEPILPVSMELRKEHRKLALAIVVALDRSGSMAVPVGGGKVKMDLANLGTVQVLDMLGSTDEFGVLAVDTVAHVIKEFGPVTDKGPVRDRILGIQSMGGGIYVHEALVAAADMIQKAKSGTKHIILFADAADAEKPGSYREIIEECGKAGITVSVIGLGKETDKDGELLKDIAKRGGGRCFFSSDPEELPRLFAQDTFVVARSAFLDQVTNIKTTPGLNALTGKAFSQPLSIGGYNLCYLRPGANLATVSVDEYSAPVVAAWQAGSGRVLCYTGEADGSFTGPIAKWKEVGNFFTSLARWTGGPSGNLPDNMLLTQDVSKGIARIRLHLDPERKNQLAQLPAVKILRGQENKKPQVDTTHLHWTGADTLAAEVPLQGTEIVLATVEVPGHGPAPLTPVCLPYSPEFNPAQAGGGLAALERLARATGGKERLELAGIWKELPKAPRRVDIAPWLLLAAVVLLLLEILERRTGLLIKTIPSAGNEEQKAAPSGPWFGQKEKTAPAPAAVVPAAPAQAKPMPTSVETDGGLLEALRQARAKQRGREPPKE
jgi:Mg-chelatase subunit ChlD